MLTECKHCQATADAKLVASYDTIDEEIRNPVRLLSPSVHFVNRRYFWHKMTLVMVGTIPPAYSLLATI